MKKLLYIDLFCGAGGTSTGVEAATLGGQKCAKVIACVNHDPHAIASHLANHPEAKHYTEDIRTLDLTTLVRHTEKQRKRNPGSLLVLWASLECTNFSRAKGGMPRDADSRTLAEHLFRYIDALRPDYIQIENVREFMMWGDLDENGRPVSRDAGRLYLRWVKNVCSRGYRFNHRILNAADYGAYTSRERFFGIFAKGNLPIVFPEPTHSKAGGRTLFGKTDTWKPVREVLDLDDSGKSIFRDKPLSENTLKRIYAGLIKFIAGGQDAFMMRYNSVRPQDTVRALNNPCGVLTTANRFALVKTQFLSKYFSGDVRDKNISVDGPAGTITTKDHHAFITAYYKHGTSSPLDKPAPTLTTKDRLTVVTSRFIDNQYGTGVPSSVETAAHTVTTNPKLNLVSVKKTKTDAANRMYYLVNPQFQSEGASIDKPCFTLIARMDKKPPYLVSTETGEPSIVVYDSDSEMTVKIKEFMALYGIADICMRMLKISELKKIMGFPEDYVLVGTKTEQKKYIGNAVETHMACALCRTISREVNNLAS